MAKVEPEKSYIWQPYGAIGNLNPHDPKKMYGVSAKGNGSRGSIEGLTKEQADAILKILEAA